MNNVMVSICCIAYNHERYITDTLEGFVMQKTNFPFEIVISDDCSKDGTRDIIDRYKSRYPELFKDVSPQANLGSINNFLYVQRKAVGKYIAVCEGDDYWTDPLKLQKQVDFMESNPDYSLCFTNTMVKYVDHDVIAVNHVWDTYSIEDLIRNNALNVVSRGDNIVSSGHTSTLLYRRPEFPLPDWISHCFIGDEPLFIALAQYGKAKFINEITSVYRAGVGISSMNYQAEVDWENRALMYKSINEGLGFRYKSIINPIIAQYYFKVFKLKWKTKCRQDSIKYLFKSIVADRKAVMQWIKNKI